MVEALLRIRDNGQGEKQVRVRWEGYRRETWEPYESIKQQLPEMMAELEHELVAAEVEEESTLSAFPERVHRSAQGRSSISLASRSAQYVGASGSESLSTHQVDGRGAEEENHESGQLCLVLLSSCFVLLCGAFSPPVSFLCVCVWRWHCQREVMVLLFICKPPLVQVNIK